MDGAVASMTKEGGTSAMLNALSVFCCEDTTLGIRPTDARRGARYTVGLGVAVVEVLSLFSKAVMVNRGDACWMSDGQTGAEGSNIDSRGAGVESDTDGICKMSSVYCSSSGDSAASLKYRPKLVADPDSASEPSTA